MHPPRLLLSRRTHTHPVVRFLDEKLFPWVVAFLTSRTHILFLLALIFVVEDPKVSVVIALMAGNWTNIISASASAIVLRQQSNQHGEVTEHHEAHADAFEQILARLDAMERRLPPAS
jgi:predicted PurR-regulated permease PerM